MILLSYKFTFIDLYNSLSEPFKFNLKKLFKNFFIFIAVDINYIFLTLLKVSSSSNLVFKKIDINFKGIIFLFINLDPKAIILALLCCLDNLVDLDIVAYSGSNTFVFIGTYSHACPRSTN